MRRAALITALGLSLAACSKGVGVGGTPASGMSVTLERVGEEMRVTYASAEPVTALDFRRVAGPARAERWRLPDGFALVHDADGDTDTLARADGAPFNSVTATVPATYTNLPKDYAPFSPFSDGGLLIHSGRFQACAEMCPEEDGDWSQAMSLAIPAGEHAIVEGEIVRDTPARWTERADGRNIYLGRAEPVETDRVIALVDTALPSAVRGPLDSLLPKLMDAFAQRFGELDAKPELYVSIEPPPDLPPGTISYSVQGGTLPGQIFMHHQGNLWLQPVGEWRPEDRRFLPVFFAHEAAHLFQRVEGVDREDEASWIHEGGADALALVVLRDLGEMDDDGLDAEVAQRLETCATGLAEIPLSEAIRAGRFDLHYACGMAVQIAAVAEGADLVAVWRDFRNRVGAGEAWDADTFRETLREHGASEAAELSARLSSSTAMNSTASRPTLRPTLEELQVATAGWRNPSVDG